MRAPWFYCARVQPGPIDLPVAELRHATGPLRLRCGDAVVLFDGAGTIGRGRITALGRAGGRVEVDSLERPQQESPVRLTLAVALPKGDRQTWVMEKCTELGVTAIWPMISANSVVQQGAGQLARWRRTAIEAAKQCRRARLPVIEPAQSFAQVVGRAGAADRAVMAHTQGPRFPLMSALRELRAGAAVLALVGPEGGWSAEEVQIAEAAGIQCVELGPLVLRVESAAIAIAAAVRLAIAATDPSPHSTGSDIRGEERDSAP